MEILYFIFFSLLWLFTFIYYYKSKKIIDGGAFVLILSFCCSIFTILLLTDNYYYTKYAKLGLSVVPLIYVYIVSLISYSPLLLLRTGSIKQIKVSNFLLLDITVIIFVVCMIIRLSGGLSDLTSNLILLMVEEDGGANLYAEKLVASSGDMGSGAISNISAVITNAIYEILILIFFVNIIFKRRIILNIILFISLLFVPVVGIANGQRTSFVLFFMALISTYFLCKEFIQPDLIKKINRLLLFVVIICSIPLVALTVSRFSKSSNGSISSIVNYVGQSTLNFDIYGFDNNGIRNGDRVFPLFKRLLGFHNVPVDFWERRIKYSKLKINDEVFVGYIGDIVLDFGPILSFILFVGISSLTLVMTRNKGHTLSLNKLLILQLLIVMVSQGSFYLYPFADNAGLKIIAYVMFYIAMTVSIRKGHKHNVQRLNFKSIY